MFYFLQSFHFIFLSFWIFLLLNYCDDSMTRMRLIWGRVGHAQLPLSPDWLRRLGIERGGTPVSCRFDGWDRMSYVQLCQWSTFRHSAILIEAFVWNNYNYKKIYQPFQAHIILTTVSLNCIDIQSSIIIWEGRQACSPVDRLRWSTILNIWPLIILSNYGKYNF